MRLDRRELRDRVLGPRDPLAPPVGDELGAELAARFLVGGGQEHEIALERHVRALERQHRREMQDARGLHVDRAAAIEIAVGDRAAERVDGPVAAIGVHDIDVVVQDDPAERAVAGEARAKAGPAGRGLDRLALDPVAGQHLGQEPGARDLVSGRVRGVDRQIAAQQIDRLVAESRPVHHRLSASGFIARMSPSSQRAM